MFDLATRECVISPQIAILKPSIFFLRFIIVKASNREYYEYYGLTPDKLTHAREDALIMHPGPMNRGIEIDTKLADDINRSVIKEQVELGVAVRMACLKIFCD